MQEKYCCFVVITCFSVVFLLANSSGFNILWVWVLGYGLWVRLRPMPARDLYRLFIGPHQSGSELVPSGKVVPMKNLRHSCKYSAAVSLKVWFARGAIKLPCKESTESLTMKANVGVLNFHFHIFSQPLGFHQ